ncbi:MAG: WD40 repeat domain-containing protein [Burkholderiales bacterium]|nr:WD40 repeat domain-containing protein [Anaerolineae bacterium]
MLMRLRLSAALLLFVLFIMSAGAPQVQAQQPPNIAAALADLSAQVGQTVTLNNLSGFSWTELAFNDTSLGCPQEGQTYTRTHVNGYQFLLTYNDVGYDYRVSLDSSIIVLCTSTAQNTTTPAGGIPATSTAPAQPNVVFVTPTQTIAPTLTPNTAASLVPTSESIIIGQATSLPDTMPEVTVTLMGAAAAVQPTTSEIVPAATLDSVALPNANLPATSACPGAPAIRLTVGGWGQKINDNVALNVRVDPARGTEVVTQLADGAVFYVVEGPQCDPSGLSWFLIDFSGFRGWVAEGNETSYFVEPIATPPPTPTLAPALPPTTDPAAPAPTAAPVATTAPLVTPPPLAANAITAANAAQVVDLGSTGATAPGTVNAVAIGQPAGLPPGIILGAGGGLNLWGLSAPDALLASFGAPEQGYTPFAYSPLTNRLAAAELTAESTWQIHIWDLNGLPGSVVDLHTVPVTDVTALAFSPNGAMLAASQSGTGVVLYDVTSGTVLATVPQTAAGPTRSLAFSANGQWLAVVEPPQSVRLWDVSGTAPADVGVLPNAVSDFTALAFSPAANVLAVGVMGDVAVWDLSAGIPTEPRNMLPIYGQSGYVTDLAFSADGSTLAISAPQIPENASLSSSVILWDVTSAGPGAQLNSLAVIVPVGDVLAFSPDGSRLVTLGADNALHLWGVS